MSDMIHQNMEQDLPRIGLPGSLCNFCSMQIISPASYQAKSSIWISSESRLPDESDLEQTNFWFGMVSFINLKISFIIGHVGISSVFPWFRISITVQ